MNPSETSTRRIVKERSQGCCEKCGVLGEEMHHRKNRSQRGRWTPANIVLLCRDCHAWVTVNPVAAKELGLSVHPTEDPEAVPIRTGAVPFLLAEDGDYLPCDPYDVLLPIPGWAR